jgi:site-specific recombinase XerD
MTPLRKRFIEDLQLHGYAPSTQQVYVCAIKQVAGHYRRSPDELTEEQIRQYFLHLTLVRKVSRSNATITLCALKFFYEHTLQRSWPVFALARPRREKKLPLVLSREEVRQLLGAVQDPVYRAYFTTVYACGLRLEEARQLQISDVDGQRGLLRIRGKGNKDRYVPLPSSALQMLRTFWKTHRSNSWLFPAPRSTTAPRPLSRKAIQEAFATARERAGLTKHPTTHSLRHAYATHLLEQNVNLRLIQNALGHNSPTTTAIYTHLTEPALAGMSDPLNRLMQDL